MNEPAGPTPEPVHVWVSTTDENPRPAAHHLLRHLATSLGHAAPLIHTATGRPVVDGLHVSLSHTTGVIAVAATHTGPVGVDVELRRDFPVGAMAARWFTPAEAGRVDSPAAFLRLWTAKEAVGKALGQGLRNQGLRREMPAVLTGEPTMDEQLLVAHVVPSEPLLVVHVHTDLDVVLALAFPRSVTEVVLHQGTTLRSTVRSRTSFPVVVRGN
ncbi:4'-phosphopantetheinyl transferase family protein [Kribbella sp. CA-253562]|uniref:4'-phosphopantetheinyl transferase family protein n=1 Tax=Kribbella sp. CA-253562 TaxID=3239942 RepID=UPI003D8FDB1F